jgi:hypothetical protein
MSQHDFNIANQGFPAFRSDLNDALVALGTNASGATEPSTTFAHQFWMDTAADPSILKVRNADNDAWITLGTFNQTADTFTPAGVTSDKIEEGNSKVEVVDTGTGYIVFEVDGAEVARFNPDQLVTKAGTASTPAISPTGDLNTGIFFPAADTIAFAEGGAEAMRIDSDGDVGIGTTAPAKKLHVSGGSSGGTFPTDTILAIEDNDGTTLSLLGGTSSILGITLGDSADNDRFKIECNTTSGSRYMAFTVDASERMRIDSSGNLLVGTTSAIVLGHGASNSLNTTSSIGHAVSLTCENASYAEGGGGAIPIGVLRGASSSYGFAGFYSGNGSTSGFTDKEFFFRGDGNGYADGTFNNNGADYAEFFESANGQALTLGATVVLDGNKVREATDQDPASAVIGVVRPKEPSKASMVVGNTAWNKWSNKYLTDDFDRYIMEDHDVVEWEEIITDEDGNTSTKKHSYESQAIPEGITVPQDATRKTHDENGVKFQHYKLNPAWNPDSEYVNRENRPEWNIIGLLGQVKILKGQPVGDRWIKMRDVSDTVEEWFIR